MPYCWVPRTPSVDHPLLKSMMVQAIPQPIFYITLNRQGVVLAMAATTAIRLGYRANDWIGQSGLALFHADDWGVVTQGLQSAGLEPEPLPAVHLLTGDGTQLKVHLTLQVLQTLEGHDSLLAIAEPLSWPQPSAPEPVPMSSLPQTAPSLALPVERLTEWPIPDGNLYRAMVDELPHLSLLLFDGRLCHRLLSGRGLAAVNLTAEQVVGKTLSEIWPEEIATDLQPLYQAALAGDPRVAEVAVGDRLYQIYGFPIRDPQGQVVLGMALVQDITALTQTEAALHYQAEMERQHRLVAQTSAEFSRHIRHSLDLDAVLTTAVTEIQRILVADRVLIYRTYGGQRGCILKEMTAIADYRIGPTPDETATCPLDCFADYQDGNIRAISDQTIDRSDCCQCPLNFEAQAKLVVPIVRQSELWGLVLVQQCEAPRQWQSWEIELISQLARQLEIAVYQSELYQQVQQLNANLEDQIQRRTEELQRAYDFEATLKRITDRVRDSLEEDQILQAAVRELATVTEVSGCNASIYDLQAGTSSVRYEYTTTDLPYHGRVVQLDAFPEAYTALLKGQPTQFCSLIPNPIRGAVATLAVPILDDKGVLGDLWLVNHHDYAFSEADIRLVQQVANQCAIAIRQARLYQASMAQVRELERLNQLKDDFLSTVSHELRTPMSNVKMAIQMLEILLQQAGNRTDNVARIERYLKILHEESQREINLINDLLDLARLDSGHDRLQLSPLQMVQWLPRCIRAFEEQALSHQQTLQVSCASNLPTLITDASKLERILTELLTNAFKYTPSEERIMVAVTAIAPVDKTIAMQLSVTNTGTTIAPEEQTRIFEKFYRIPNNDPWQHGGTGLGLALVKEMAQQMGGSLRVESGQGQTQFIVTLPITPGSATPEGYPPKPPASSEAPVE